MAKSKGVAVAGMKIIGLGQLSRIYDRALLYAFGLPIDTAVVGVESMEQLKKNLAVAEAYKPLSDVARLELFRKVLPMVTPNVVYWKAEDRDKPSEWKKR